VRSSKLKKTFEHKSNGQKMLSGMIFFHLMLRGQKKVGNPCFNQLFIILNLPALEPAF
jgi:hypothetical protein